MLVELLRYSSNLSWIFRLLSPLKMTIDALTKSTPVRLTIIQFCLLISVIGTCTAALVSSIHEIKDQLHSQADQISRLQVDVTILSTKEATAEKTTQDRLDEWWRWRWSVTADIGTLSFKTSTPVLTKQP